MSAPSFSHIDINLTYGVIICIHHQYCILPNTIYSHFSTRHSDHTTTTERKELQTSIDGLYDQLYQDYSQIEPPTTPCRIIPGLRVHYESLKCNECGHIHAGQSAIENMKGHLRMHGITATLVPRGSSYKALAKWWASHWRVVTTQQFFTRAGTKDQKASSHFEVYHEEGEPPTVLSYPEPGYTATTESSITSPLIDPRLATIDRLQAQFEDAEFNVVNEEYLLQATVPMSEDRQTNPYLEHTQFQKCVEGLSWQRIREYTHPTPSPRLKFLQDTIKSMALTYQHTITITSRWARIRVMQEHYQHIPVTPLFHYQAYDLKHSNTLVKIFAFFHQVLSEGFAYPPTLQVTTRQKNAWIAIQQHLDSLASTFPGVDLKHTRSTLTPFEILCHQFWLALIEQTAVASDFELSLVTPLAFIAVDPQQDQFRAAYNFATDLSAIKKFARYAACQLLHENHLYDGVTLTTPHESLEDKEIDTLPTEAAELIQEQAKYKRRAVDQEEQIRSSNTRFKTWVYQYLTTEYSTAIGWVITTAHFISRFRYGETLDAFVRWNGPTVSVRHISTTFEKYTAMVWSLYHRAEGILTQLTFTHKLGDLPIIPWDEIQCDLSNTEAQYTPFSPKQPALVHGRDTVRRNMIQAVTKAHHKSSTISDLGNYDQVKRYGDLVQEYLSILFLLIHFTSGQPGRLTEVLSVQSENTVTNGIRNIFLFGGHVAIVPRYHKGYNRDKTLKIVYRFLPKEIGSLLVWYLWLVRPFYKVVTQQQSTDNRTSHFYHARSAFLWSDRNGKQILDSRTFGELMRRETMFYLGEEIGPSIMRHLIIAFGRRCDLKKGHQLQALTPEEVEETTNYIEAEAREMQAGHMPNTATAIYALETVSLFRNRFDASEAHLKTSLKWHQELGFKRGEEIVKLKQQTEQLSSNLSKKIADRAGINILRVLQENFGASWKFRGRQADVIQEIVQGEPIVSYITGTGVGKSMAFLVPACCPNYGQTLIITPLVALRKDIARKCKQVAITYSQFGERTFNETAKMILAMPEHLANDQFTMMVDRRRDNGHLERIVLDEFHYVLLSDHDYRPLLLKLRDLARYLTPITLLSATVPFREEQEAYRLLGLGGSVKTFRESTVRTNIRYEVETLPQKTRVTIEDLAEYVHKEQSNNTKILVYASSVDTVQALAKLLDCYVYHSKMAAIDRNRVQEEFNLCQRGVLVATTAFNAGVDVPDIRLVIRIGEPDHPITYQQESGRAGRDGLPCAARILLGFGIYSFIDKLDGPTRTVLEQIMLRDGDTPRCMRIPIDKYFDGPTNRVCCKQGEEPCTICQKTRSRTQESHQGLPQTPTPRHKEVSTNTQKHGHNTESGSKGIKTTLLEEETPVHATGLDSFAMSSPVDFRTARRSLPDPFGRPGLESNRLPLSNPSLLSSPVFDSSPSFNRGTRLRDESPVKRPHNQGSSPPNKSKTVLTQQLVTLSPSESSMISDSARGEIKLARTQRILNFNREEWLTREKEGADVTNKQLKETGTMWTRNCVRCFVDGKPFDHPKETCATFTGQLVQTYRMQRMRGDMGKPQCWTCFFPMSLCNKWLDPETGETLSRPRPGSVCTYPRSILDTWACLWEFCPKAKQVWLARIKEQSDGNLDGEVEEDFRAYFREMIHFKGSKPVGRIAYDVNWLTQTYFLEREMQGKELLN